MKILIKFGDERLTIAEAASRVGISVTAMRYRVFSGWPKEMLFSRDRYVRVKGKAQLVPQPARSPTHLDRVMREYTSPFRAAIDSAITAEEYLQLDRREDHDE